MITATAEQAPTPRAFRVPDLSRRAVTSPRLAAPSFRKVTVDGARCYAVGLAGKVGEGWEALVDADGWKGLREVAGERWHLIGPDIGRAYVSTCTVAARAAVGSTSSVVGVARVIAARRGDNLEGMFVASRSGLRLDLRAQNLRVCPDSAGRNYQPDMPLPVVVDGWSE